MKDFKILLVVLVVGLTILVSGCNNDPAMQHDTSKMGPMPTKPPAEAMQHMGGNASAPSSLTPQQFMDKLQTLPADQRKAFADQNSSAVGAIMGGQDEGMKTKLRGLMSPK